MSAEPSVSLPDQRFTLGAPPPVRPLAIAAVSMLVGAVLVVGWQAIPLPVAVGVIGLVLLAAGLALVVLALLLSARLTVVLRLTESHAELVRPGPGQRLAWSDVRTVTLDHPRLTLTSQGEGVEDLVVVNPRRPDDPAFTQLIRALRARLDRDRGYGA